ncbi:hypothetical protein M0802_002253 [Mischocyttarus mexicanus]|nr:hypothetical protein M0802_002253 [Mischocyttarus mexicanus]
MWKTTRNYCGSTFEQVRNTVTDGTEGERTGIVAILLKDDDDDECVCLSEVSDFQVDFKQSVIFIVDGVSNGGRGDGGGGGGGCGIDRQTPYP